MSGGILSPRAVTAGGERFAVSVRLWPRDWRWGSDGFARFTGSEAHETFADFGFVEGIGTEGTTVPTGQFVVVVVLGVFERFEEGVEARQSAPKVSQLRG